MLFLLALTTLVHSQQVTVHVFGMQPNGKKAPVKAATIKQKGQSLNSITDTTGKAVFTLPDSTAWLFVAADGYNTDSILPDPAKTDYYLMLFPTKQLNQVDIITRNYDTKMDLFKTIKVETIGSNELKKAACCNLAESFESNASVDVVYTDALSGARTIQMLGLSGLYAPIQIENVPYTRGLAANFGMSFIPGTWLQGIQITKGVGSVVNGYESMTGIINIELLKPEDEKTETMFVNGYGSTMGRAEANIHLNKKFNKKWSTLLMLHGNGNFTENDMNHDGFRDNPLSQQGNVLNRWKRQGEKTEQVLVWQSLVDDKTGGQTGASPNYSDQALYGVNIRSQMHQVYFKNGFLFPKKTMESLGLIGSFRYMENLSHFGTRIFNAQQKSGYFNSIYHNYIGNTFHQIKAGASFIFDQTTTFNGIHDVQTEYVPGAYVEYSYDRDKIFTLLLGNRIDYHNQFGWQYTPRVHMRYQLNEKASLRALAGTGFRTSKTIMENISALASSRIILARPDLRPEKTFNTGLSYTQEMRVGKNNWMLSLDYYYTQFMNQVVVDYDMHVRELNIYNLTGQSYAHSVQAEMDMQLSSRWQLRVAYKYYDVKVTTANVLQQRAMVAPNRVMANLSFKTRNKIWKVDLINNWIDAARIPNTEGNPPAYRFNKKGEQLLITHIQVTKLFRKFETYIGVENLLNQTQHDAILASNDPFGSYFDAGLIWGPLNGRVIYAGFRYSLRK